MSRFIYNAPTSATISGLQVVRHQQIDATLAGAEFSTAFEVAEPLTVHASYDFVNREERMSGAALPLMPPPRTIISATVHSSHLGSGRPARRSAPRSRTTRHRRTSPRTTLEQVDTRC